MKKIQLLFILCLLSFAASAVRRFPSSITAPYAGAAQSVCAGTTNTATTVTYALCGTTSGGAALSVTPTWYLNGALVFTGTAFNTAAGGGTITLAAGSFTYATAGVYTGVNGLYCKLTWATAAPAACAASLTVSGTPTNVTVTAVPTAITGLSAVCGGSTITLSDPIAGGTWSTSNSSVATIVTATRVVTGGTTGTTTITYSTGCGTAPTHVVTVTAAPLAISGLSTVCSGATITLSEAITGGTWSTSNSTVATIVTATRVVTGGTTGTSTITYSTGCGSPVTHVITTIAAPTAISGLGSVCAGSSIPMSNGTNGGVWSSSVSSVATITSSGLVWGGGFGTTTISYSTGCGTTATHAVNVNDIPGIIHGASTICELTTTTLSNLASGGAWSSSNSTVATITGTTGVVSGRVSGNTTITYSTGCGSPTTLAFTVDSLPVTPPAITGNLVVCGTTTLSDALGGGVWSSNNTMVATINSSALVTGVSTGTAVISYARINACGSTFATTTVTVAAFAAPAAITGMGSVCIGGTRNLNDVVPGGVWSSSNTSIATVNGTGLVTGVSAGTVTITYMITTGCGSGFRTATVTTLSAPAPTVAAITGPTVVCVGNTIRLSDPSTGGVWSSNSLSIAIVNSSGIASGVGAGSTTISYTVTNSCGAAFATAPLTVKPILQPADILGAGILCLSHITMLSDAVAGGFWSSSNSSVATVTSTGVVTGVSLGFVNISYTLSNSCNTASTFNPMSVVYDGHCITEVSGISNIDEITVYPNPSIGTFTISGSFGTTGKDKVSIEITNMMGQIVYKENTITTAGKLNNRITLGNNLASGLYLVNLRSGTTSKKLHITLQ